MTRVPRRPSSRARRLAVTAAGVALRQSAPVVGAALLALWTVLAASRVGGRPQDVVATCAAGAAAYVAGLLLHRWRWILGPLVAAAVVGLFAISADAFSGRPMAAPLGYGNANAALLVQAAAAFGMAVTHRSRNVGAVAALGCGLCVVLTIPTRSAAGLATGVLVLAAVVVAWTGHSPRETRLSLGLVGIAAVPVLSVLLATRPWLPGLADAERALTPRRVALWTDAVDLLRTHPTWGTGPENFARNSPTALADLDTTAAHSVGLEVGAELGVVGGLLLAFALVAVLVTARLAARRDASAALVAGAAWLALCAHASIDYVMDFPAVVVLAAFVAGLGSVLPGTAARTARHHPGRAPNARSEAGHGGPDPSM